MQVNRTFRARWLASSEVFSNYTVLYKYAKRKRNIFGRFYFYFISVSIFWEMWDDYNQLGATCLDSYLLSYILRPLLD